LATHIFTSIIANYIPKARVLAETLKRHHPEIAFHLFICDAIPAQIGRIKEPFTSIWTVADLEIENCEQWLFQRSLTEASTGIKGLALLKLLDLPDCTEVLYFDPDIVILQPLEEILQRFTSASILLTPHLTEPETTFQAIIDNEVCALQHGAFNLGFLGVKNSEEGRRFANWWAHRLHHFCWDDIPNGLFTDQRWIDLVPGFFADHAILRQPGYNVCTWNLTHRTVEGSLRSGLRVNGEPVTFYHFSGIDSGAQAEMLNKYGAKMPALYELRSWYLSECARLGQKEFAVIPWKYAAFDNGHPVHRLHRLRYRQRVDLRAAFPNPFATSDHNNSYYHWFEVNDEAKELVPNGRKWEGLRSLTAFR
jgi:hypothetical protein